MPRTKQPAGFEPAGYNHTQSGRRCRQAEHASHLIVAGTKATVPPGRFRCKSRLCTVVYTTSYWSAWSSKSLLHSARPFSTTGGRPSSPAARWVSPSGSASGSIDAAQLLNYLAYQPVQCGLGQHLARRRRPSHGRRRQCDHEFKGNHAVLGSASWIAARSRGSDRTGASALPHRSSRRNRRSSNPRACLARCDR